LINFIKEGIMKKLLILAAIAFGLGYIGCSDNDVTQPDNQSGEGNISFSINKASAPGDVVKVSALLTRDGYDDLTASLDIQNSSNSDLSFSKVPAGSWHLQVTASDASNKVLYSAEANVTVTNGKTAQVQLSLLPTEGGTGEVEIGIDWGTYNSVVLQPGPEEGKDAAIYYTNTYKNFGDDPNMPLYSAYFGDKYNMSRALLDFDLSSVPSDAHVVKAELYLYYNASAIPGGGTMHHGPNGLIVQRVVAPWDENEVAWTPQPDVTWEDTVNVAKSNSGTQNYAIDVTKLVVKNLSSPADSYGFMIRLANENLWTESPEVLFYSSDCADAAKRPKLVVIYE
jgi:hypothetical protein